MAPNTGSFQGSLNFAFSVRPYRLDPLPSALGLRLYGLSTVNADDLPRDEGTCLRS